MKNLFLVFKLFFILLLIFSTSILCLAQTNPVEIFNPNTTLRTQKQVETYLPFQTKKQKVSVEIVDNMAIMEGDIILGSANMFQEGVIFAIVINEDSYRWLDGIIPYVIQNGHPRKARILRAIQYVNAKTNLQVIPKTFRDEDFVEFNIAEGCSSFIGRQGGPQVINIGPCSFGSIVHEILHAAGMFHEQSRSDRDQYITINWDNIEEDNKFNFDMHNSDGRDIGNYDCSSIMHYGPKSWSKNGEPTIIINNLNNPNDNCESIGQRYELSPGDIIGVNTIYTRKARPYITKIEDAFVELYDDTYFKDRRLTVIPNRNMYNLDYVNSDSNIRGFGDKASSVRWQIPKGYKVELYDDANYRDRKLELIGDGRLKEIKNLDLKKFGDKTSSLKWVKIPSPSEAIQAYVTLYDDKNFKDRKLTIRYGKNISKMSNARSDNGKKGFNDKASSVRWFIPKGHKFVLYDDAGYSDRKLVLDGNGKVQQIKNLNSKNFGDKASSGRWER